MSAKYAHRRRVNSSTDTFELTSKKELDSLHATIYAGLDRNLVVLPVVYGEAETPTLATQCVTVDEYFRNSRCMLRLDETDAAWKDLVSTLLSRPMKAWRDDNRSNQRVHLVSAGY